VPRCPVLDRVQVLIKMTNLQAVFQQIAQAPDAQTLQSQIKAAIPHFAAQRGGLFLFEQITLADARLQKALELGLSVEHNPMLRYLIEHHAPVHEALVTSPKTWQMICPRPDHWHVMAGPIVHQGQLIGAVGFTRSREQTSFNSANLADLSALCLHLSSRIATLQTHQTHQPTPPLTPREQEIASLVAQGHTNAEIGRQLWITENSVKQALKRMFRKLAVSSRAEMVAKLALHC
jgi:DNA-binding CsgD family transcriptional regulator